VINKKHNKQDLPVKTEQAKTADPELMRNATATAGPASSLSRRKFFGAHECFGRGGGHSRRRSPLFIGQDARFR